MQKLFEEMVDVYADRIYRLAMRYTGSFSEAEDITQETFLRAYKNLHRYDPDRPAGPWLFKIAANLCRNRVRDSREIPVDLSEESLASSGPGPEDLYLVKERDEEVRKAIDHMPHIYRDVLLLKHVGELSYAEICSVLGLELSLVKNRLYRGRIMLKEALVKGGSE